ncbi:MAG: hypothetical protein ABJQ78_16645 [Alloalcanivorax sp.]
MSSKLVAIHSMKAFIVQTLKKEVYDDPKYQADIRARLKEFEGTRREGREGFYTQLRRFAQVIMVSIFMALISAVLHGTIGFFNAAWSSWFCIFFTAFSWLVFLWALILVSRNISKMLSLSEEKASG